MLGGPIVVEVAGWVEVVEQVERVIELEVDPIEQRPAVRFAAPETAGVAPVVRISTAFLFQLVLVQHLVSLEPFPHPNFDLLCVPFPSFPSRPSRFPRAAQGISHSASALPFHVLAVVVVVPQLQLASTTSRVPKPSQRGAEQPAETAAAAARNSARGSEYVAVVETAFPSASASQVIRTPSRPTTEKVAANALVLIPAAASIPAAPAPAPAPVPVQPLEFLGSP